jgi:hypothetical protein
VGIVSGAIVVLPKRAMEEPVNTSLTTRDKVLFACIVIFILSFIARLFVDVTEKDDPAVVVYEVRPRFLGRVTPATTGLEVKVANVSYAVTAVVPDETNLTPNAMFHTPTGRVILPFGNTIGVDVLLVISAELEVNVLTA